MTPYSTDITLSTSYLTIAGFNPNRSYLSIYNQSTTSTEFVLLRFRNDLKDSPTVLALKVKAGQTLELKTDFIKGEVQASSATGTPTITINEY